ncbi:MAG TPA: hypothetical protein VMR70_14255 [Flavisolibacter sp.]|nr:hypothetical protein [Flavisolibacter sp.]
MKKELWQLDVDKLRMLHREEERQLEEKLLAGVTWEELAEERKRIGELSTIIYKKLNPAHFIHPAANDSRPTAP